MKNIRISEIINLLKMHNLLVKEVESDLVIKNVSINSQEILSDTLFICKGFNFKKQYLLDAIDGGAIAYISEVDLQVDIQCIIVSDSRIAMAVVYAYYYDYPHKQLFTTAITGTKGKTSTSYFLKSILDKYENSKTGILSTVEMYTGDEMQVAHLTTPEANELYSRFEMCVNNDINYLTMEVSSQAYKLNRVYGIRFDIGVFLNIDLDHIGAFEHRDYDDYFNCKLQLMKNCKTAIIYQDSKDFDIIYQTAKNYADKVIVFGHNDSCDYYCTNITKLELGYKFNVIGPDGCNDYAINNEGRFNIVNAMCSIICAKQINVDEDSIKQGIKHLTIQGRMNSFKLNESLIVVDYAHNNLSFKQLFESFNFDYSDYKITVITGAPGDKAFQRRSDIATLCSEYADKIIYTTEDPGFEDPSLICIEMLEYTANKQKVIIEIDREKAILDQLNQIDGKQILIVAGKGEEVYQKVCGKFVEINSDFQIVSDFVGSKKKEN